MLEGNRRRFLQLSALAAGASYARFSWGADVPSFSEQPSFEPTGLFLTWQRDPTTTMTVQWVGKAEDGRDRPIWFVEKDGLAWRSEPCRAQPFPLTELTIFRAELTGLKPDTEYVFRVGLDSAEQRFRTMPTKATDTIHFVSGGDSGVNEHAVQSNKLAAAQAPRFVVLGGDIAYENGKSPEVFLQFLKNYSRDLRDPQQRLIPLLGCIGNHEVNGGHNKLREDAPFFYSIFGGLFPETGYASLDFGDYLSLVFLDTGHTSPIEGAQTDWLEQTLKPREDFPTVFVYNHVPAYPSVRPPKTKEGAEATGSGNRKHWCPLFERYNVDAVFEHHDHAYKRSHPLNDGLIDQHGVLYLGDGSWGKIRRPETPEQRPYLAKTDEAYHLSLHRIEGRDRYHIALSDTGRIVDVCTTRKRPRA